LLSFFFPLCLAVLLASPQNVHNGYETIYGLLQLATNLQVPDVFASIDGGLSSDSGGGDFSAWRTPGTNASLLWPDSDTFGRALLHFPPLQLIMNQFSAEEGPWEDRAPVVYWSGDRGFNDGGSARDRYRECARIHPASFVADIVQWSGFQELDGRLLKPHVLDLRKLMRSRYNIYIRGNTWSQSYSLASCASCSLALSSSSRLPKYMKPSGRR
jgi:hypothetical protein